MNVGISTGCFYPLEPEKAIYEISKLNTDKIEIFFNCDYELTDEYIKDLKKQIDEYDLKVISVHPFTSGFEPNLLFSNYKRRTQEYIDKYCRYFDVCNILGARIVNLHGDRINRKIITEEEYCEVYFRLWELGKKQSVIFSQENVNMFKSSMPDFIKKMRKVLNDNVNFTFDIKQAIRAGVDIYEMIDAMGEKICNVHINDDKNGMCVLPGKGTLDYNKILSKLNEYHYNGEYLIEVYSDCYEKNSEIFSAINYVNSFF